MISVRRLPDLGRVRISSTNNNSFLPPPWLIQKRIPVSLVLGLAAL
jgi:hypothetical protein